MENRSEVLNGIPAEIIEVLSEQQIELLVDAVQKMIANATRTRSNPLDYQMLNPSMAIKATRKQAGLTQKEMSEQLGIPRRTLEDWEAGKRTPPKYVQHAIVMMLLDIAADAHDAGHTK